MKNLRYWGMTTAMGFLIIMAYLWATSEMRDREDPLNKPDSFMYSDNGKLYWFELASRNDRVSGILYQKKIIEKVGNPPVMEERKYLVAGKKTGKGYLLNIKIGGKIITYNAGLSGPNLLVQQQGETGSKLFKAVDQQELDEYVTTIQQEWQIRIYYSEEKEKRRLRKFFTELKNNYGYLYSAKNGSFQLFLKIDEANIQGDLSGSLLMMTDTGNKTSSYEETKYTVNGITDGLMLLLITNVDGKKIKLKGNFHGDADSFDLSFWTTDQKLPFHDVTEKEFKKSYEQFKTKTQNKR